MRCDVVVTDYLEDGDERPQQTVEVLALALSNYARCVGGDDVAELAAEQIHPENTAHAHRQQTQQTKYSLIDSGCQSLVDAGHSIEYGAFATFLALNAPVSTACSRDNNTNEFILFQRPSVVVQRRNTVFI